MREIIKFIFSRRLEHCQPKSLFALVAPFRFGYFAGHTGVEGLPTALVKLDLEVRRKAYIPTSSVVGFVSIPIVATPNSAFTGFPPSASSFAGRSIPPERPRNIAASRRGTFWNLSEREHTHSRAHHRSPRPPAQPPASFRRSCTLFWPPPFSFRLSSCVLVPCVGLHHRQQPRRPRRPGASTSRAGWVANRFSSRSTPPGRGRRTTGSWCPSSAPQIPGIQVYVCTRSDDADKCMTNCLVDYGSIPSQQRERPIDAPTVSSTKHFVCVLSLCPSFVRGGVSNLRIAWKKPGLHCAPNETYVSRKQKRRYIR